MELKELLSGLLSAAYQMDDAGVAALYNADGTIKDDALDTLKAKDVERVKNLKPDTKKVFDDGYKKAQSESLTNQEKEFKEKTGFKSDLKGTELYLAYAADQAKAKGEITEDVVKKHPAFIAMSDKLLKEKEDAVKAESEKLTTFQTELSKKEVFNAASKKALEIFDTLKPILSQDAAKANAQRALLVEKLNGYEIEQKGDVFLVSKEGKLLEDPHGNRIPFDKIVKDTAAMYFDFHQADPRSSAGNGKETPRDSKGNTLVVPVPKDEADYIRIIGDSKTDVKIRQTVKEAWEAKNSAPATV